VAAVKNTLIAADVAGSALPLKLPNDPDRWDWITQSFNEKPTRDDLRAVIAARSETFTDKNEDREQFQAAVAASTAPVTFVKAGCGTGKTLAAYMWARDQVPGRRLYFCYPTTGTSTEGFRDYLFPPESDQKTGHTNPLARRVREVGADLFHSRRKVDFEMILSTGRDSGDADKDAAVKIDSLDAWHTPIVACTVDTVLGLVQNNKRGLFAWPALAGAAFVFDEIHAYDDRLFGALLRFLRDLPGLPILLMTASLPTVREEALRETLKKFRGINLSMIPGPESLEKLPRYHKLMVGNNDLLPEIQEALSNNGNNNGKVLWVCNTVGRVMDAAEFVETHGLTPLIYHSRFKYEHRVQRHAAVIDAFKSDGAAIAICSQVAEMSLDLSADLLVTERATVPAIIQRLGRLNRRAKKKTDPTKPFIVVEPENHLPYAVAEMEAARVWLEKLPDRGISQRDLAEKWEQTSENPPELVPSAWLDGGPTTTVTELREASPGITVLLEADGIPMLRYEARIRVALREAEQEKRPIDLNIFAPLPDERHPNDCMKLVLPMPPPPRSVDWRAWKKFHGLPIAPPEAIDPNDYDPERGAKWAEQSKKGSSAEYVGGVS
jgi:CRISPR-associated endonuclease/helicase Cas3